MVCTGAKNEEDSRLAARKFARVVQKLGYPAKFKDFKIQNMVGSCDVKFPITLEGLFLSHNKYCFYEPELFPGLVFRMIKPKIVLLIFASGKVVLTGAKVRNDIHEAFDNILPILKNFKKQWSMLWQKSRYIIITSQNLSLLLLRRNRDVSKEGLYKLYKSHVFTKIGR